MIRRCEPRATLERVLVARNGGRRGQILSSGEFRLGLSRLLGISRRLLSVKEATSAKAGEDKWEDI